MIESPKVRRVVEICALLNRLASNVRCWSIGDPHQATHEEIVAEQVVKLGKLIKHHSLLHRHPELDVDAYPLINAARKIIHVRDCYASDPINYRCEPEWNPDEKSFDDWAADLLDEALSQTGV